MSLVRISFQQCWFDLFTRGHHEHSAPWSYCMATTFRDDTRAGACPQYQDEDSIRRAHELGYRGDLWRMTIVHEIMHTWVAEKRGLPFSVILRNVAKGNGHRWPEGGREEEGYVTAWQRYLNTGEQDDIVRGLVIRSGKPIGQLATEAQEVLAPALALR